MPITDHRETSSVDELYAELVKACDRAGWHAVRLELVLRSTVKEEGDGTIQPKYPTIGMQVDLELIGLLP